jgi:hypothetical protein
MADKELQGQEKARFPTLMALGVLMAIAVVVVAFIVDTELGIPVLLLLVICAIAAIGFRVLAGRNRSDADSTDGLVRQPATTDRPLGDTPEAHDELNPHDLPLSNPGRQTAEKMAAGIEGTTRGHDAGGAAGHVDDADPVPADEAGRGARP